MNDHSIINVLKKCQNVCSNYVKFFDSIIDYKLMKKSCICQFLGTQAATDYKQSRCEVGDG